MRYEGLRPYTISMALSNFVGFCVSLCVKSVSKSTSLMSFSRLVAAHASLVAHDPILGASMLNFFLFLDEF